VTQMTLGSSPRSEAALHLLSLLERYRESHPALDNELAQQRVLSDTLAEHQRRDEQTLAEWQTALSRRWECEVGAQRVYSAVQRQLAAHYGSDRAYAQLIAPAHPSHASTASDLLLDVRRLGVSLELLAPQLPFGAAAVAELRAAGDALEQAIDETARREAARRSVLAEQRIAANLYERACDRARKHLADVVGEEVGGA
jgi:hypothetical protein